MGVPRFAWRRTSGTIVLLALLSACQSLAPNAPGEITRDNWLASGRIALQSTSELDGQVRAESVRFEWEQHQEQYRIDLSGSFGLGRTSIVGKPSSVQLFRGKELIATAASADDLLYQQTSLELPVAQLRYWALGLASADENLKTTDSCAIPEQCSLDPILSGDWSIQYPDTMLVDGNVLPAKILATRTGLRLVIRLSAWSSAAAEIPLPGTTSASSNQ